MADSLSGEREEKRLWDVFSLEVEKIIPSPTILITLSIFQVLKNDLSLELFYLGV